MSLAENPVSVIRTPQVEGRKRRGVCVSGMSLFPVFVLELAWIANVTPQQFNGIVIASLTDCMVARGSNLL